MSSIIECGRWVDYVQKKTPRNMHKRRKMAILRTVTLTLLCVVTTHTFSQGLTWEPLDSTFTNNVFVLSVTSQGNIFAGFVFGRIYRSSDNGDSWTESWRSNSSTTLLYSSEIDKNGWVYVGTSTRNEGEFGSWVGHLIRTTNEGTSWLAVDSGLATVEVHALTSNRSNALFAGSNGGRIYRSTNNGLNWQQVRSGTILDEISCLAIDSLGNVLAGSRIGDGTANIYRSSDNGATWGPLTPITNSITSLAVAPGGLLYAGTVSAGIFMSTDQGTAWLHFGPSNLFVHALLIVGQTIFAGTTVGVYKSLLGESTWDSASTGLSNRYVRALALSPTGSLLAGTEGGICRTTGKVTGMATSQFGLPLRAMLFNAYPNPFNPLTTIRYGVPERSRVSLVVYNTLGQQVAQLVNGEVEAGYHEVRFDAAGLPSGVYLCRLQAGGHVEAKKLVVVR